MATIADFRLPVDEFPLGYAITADPGVRVELERIVPAEEDVMPFFWVWHCSDYEQFERIALETRAIRSLEEVSRTDAGRLYRARWAEAVEGLVRGVARTGVTILDGRGTSEGWRFELRFAERGDIRTFQQYCHDNGLSVNLRRVYTPRERSVGEAYQLTDDQLETIRTAYERGYFDEPQGVTQTELAEEFDISQRAVSRRLRRGLSRLVGNTVAIESRSS